MKWKQLLIQAGLSEREADAVAILLANPNLRATELANELGITRLDAYSSLEKLQSIGLVSSTADRPMRFSSLSFDEAVKHLIDIHMDLLPKSSNNSATAGSRSSSSAAKKTSLDEPKFAVLKERGHILKKIEKMAEESEESLTLSLGRFGILHFCRSNTVEAINTAAKRGIVVTVLAELDNRALRFYDELDESIEIRHTDNLDIKQVLKDSYEVIQFLSVEENPVGKGKNDAALAVESVTFAEAQKRIFEVIWDEAVPFEVASKRFTEEKIADPLKLTLGGGSFLDRIRAVLNITDELPETDTPFNPDSFTASGLEISEVRKELEKGGIASLASFGIDIPSLFRQVGHRIGAELAFTLRNIDGHIEFLNEMMDWWEYAGLGQLSYDLEPVFHIKVHLSNTSDDDDKIPLWALDDGIIEGVLMIRYPSEGGIIVQRENNGSDDEFCRYNLVNIEDRPVL